MRFVTTGNRVEPKRRGFTLIEMLIVIGVIGLLVSIVAPAVVMARSMLDAFTCKNNLRSLAMGLINYTTDNKGCLPANVNDPPNLRWMRIHGTPEDPTDVKVRGVLAPLVDNNQAIYQCPTFKGDDGSGGDKALCHYAIPSIMSGLPIGLVQEAYYFHPMNANDPANKRLLPGAPMLVEPDPASLGTFNAAARTWGNLPPDDREPSGAFEKDHKLAARRHIGRTAMAFHDGHVADVHFPDPDITPDRIFIVLSDIGDRDPEQPDLLQPKTLHLGGQNNMRSWLDREDLK